MSPRNGSLCISWRDVARRRLNTRQQNPTEDQAPKRAFTIEVGVVGVNATRLSRDRLLFFLPIESNNGDIFRIGTVYFHFQLASR
jgi:hypothetical protein